MSEVRSYSMSDVTVARLREVQRVIMAHPTRFDMDNWMSYGPGADDHEGLDDQADCGTTCCIAGWFHLATPKSERPRLSGVARTLAIALGVSEYSKANFSPVVIADNWPPPFKGQYSRARSDKGRARVAAAYIDALIAARIPS